MKHEPGGASAPRAAVAVDAAAGLSAARTPTENILHTAAGTTLDQQTALGVITKGHNFIVRNIMKPFEKDFLKKYSLLFFHYLLKIFIILFLLI